MKYATPVSGGKLSAHFGQSTEFMLIAVLLANKGVNVVLAGGMCMGPRLAFERNNIQVVLGVTEMDPEKAVLSHLNQTLISGQNVCEHGDTVCDHASHHE